MSEVVHKANFKKTVEVYMGFGQYTVVLTPVCDAELLRKSKGFPKMARFWKDATCKKCLKLKEKK